MQAYEGYIDVQDMFDGSVYPLTSRILMVELNETEKIRWQEFQELVKRQEYHRLSYDTYPESSRSEEVSIELDHPFVPVVSDFSIAAFNELYRMYVKNGVEENIYEAEVTNVKCTYARYGYIFFITLEAMEENVAGVYEATVMCHYLDGKQSLLKFIRSRHKPVGRKYRGTAIQISEKSTCEAMKEQKKDIKAQLKAQLKNKCKAMIGKEKPEKSAELISLQEEYKTVKGVCKILDQGDSKWKQINWKIKRTNTDDWFVPNKSTGLQPRNRTHHPCRGYDYHNPLTVFSYYLEIMPSSRFMEQQP